ncbi:hypothetical protein ACFV0D_00985, partial [Streptomyces sp. NPDC059556]
MPGSRRAGAPENGPRAVVLDIEGTTGSLSHVRDVLFPYARGRGAPTRAPPPRAPPPARR